MTTYFVAVVKCLSCRQSFPFMATGSSNTFGSTLYTDGCRRDGPYVGEDVGIVECPECGALSWIDDLNFDKVIDASKYYARPDPRPTASPMSRSDIRAARFDRLLRRFGSTSATSDQLRYLRTQLWWSANDAFIQRAGDLSDSDRENLEELLALLTAERDRLERAEILRELGRFDDCLTELSKMQQPESAIDQQAIVQTIEKLALEKYAAVQRVG